MSKLKTVLLVIVLLVNTVLAGGALYLASLSRQVDYGDASGMGAMMAEDIREVAGVAVDTEAGDVAVALSAMQRGGNFRVDFTAGKTAGGRHVEHEGTWDELSGAVVYRPEAQELVAVEVAFAVTSLRTDALPLTNTVLAGEKWFDYESHPTAVFACDEVTSNNFADVDATHLLAGSFTLNGITKDISIPATVNFTGQTLTLDASFELLRSDYGVEKREGSLAGAAGGVVSKVDDAVQLRVRMTASPDPSAVIAELAGVVEAQNEQLVTMGSYMAQLERRMRVVEAGGGPAGPAGPAAGASEVDVSALPAGFKEVMPVYSENVPEPTRQAEFAMVLVPSEASSGIAPFYIAAHEATWEMMRSWSYGYDLDALGKVEQIGLGLRPTPVHGAPSIMIQMNEPANPARAMSRKTAEAFCTWLSETTGRTYRLPTEQEWQHAFRAGGGMPGDLSASSWYAENAPTDSYGDICASPVGMRRPNALGVYDMLGNAAEWVVNTDNPAERVLLGGSCETAAAEIGPGWRAVEDPIAWHALYPQANSEYWYPSFPYAGLRLVCEGQSVIDNPPTGEAPAE